jgi:hypothetical protein
VQKKTKKRNQTVTAIPRDETDEPRDWRHGLALWV